MFMGRGVNAGVGWCRGGNRNGVGRIPLIEHEKNDFLDFIGFLMYFWGNYGVLIIPKWLIKVPGPIAILVGRF